MLDQSERKNGKPSPKSETKNNGMKIMVLGVRGFPNVQGGIETHAEHLYPLLADLGCNIHLIARSPYISRHQKMWRNVYFHRLWSPKTTGLEAFLHSFIGVFYAGFFRPDILHIHAIGPALMTPLARLLGIRVIVTHHGADYEREKWGMVARIVLRLGERAGMRFSSHRIVISKVIQMLVKDKCNCDSTIIPNGVNLPDILPTNDTLNKFSLTPSRYVLLVSRFVPEKRHLDLIAAFHNARLNDWKLVLVGETTQPDRYTESVLSEAQKYPDIVITGYQTGRNLQELFSHAGLFVLPSSHEGLPIALLEALSYGLTTLASDIPAHLEVDLPPDQYYPLGDITALTQLLQDFSLKQNSSEDRNKLRNWVKNKYNWKNVAKQTLNVYQKTLSG